MEIFFSVFAGLAVGAAASYLLIWASKKAKNSTPTSNLSPATALIVGVFGSLAMLFIFTFVCLQFMRDFIIPFLIAEVVALIVISVVYVVSTYIKR